MTDYWWILKALILGAGISFLILAPFFAVDWIKSLAARNILWTTVEEGRAKAVQRFGKFHHFLMSYKGHAFDNDWNVVEENKGRGRSWWDYLSFSGLRFIGIPLVDTIYKYEFRWTTLKENVEDGKYTRIPDYKKQPDTDYILVQDDYYYTEIKTAETKDLIPVNALMLMPTRILNPYKALFRVEEWLEATQELVTTAVRNWIKGKEYAEVVGKEEVFDPTKPTTEGVKDDPILGDTKVGAYILERYGVRVKRIQFLNVDPSSPEYREASTKKYVAERNAEAFVAEAKGKAEATIIAADAEKTRIEKEAEGLKNAGEEGRFARAADMLEEMSKGAGVTIIPLGSTEGIVESLIKKAKE